ncbi:MAG: hypothetical protein LBH04_11940 [Tannerellaceae bacterium]|jgi:hypothetical protein|nr:hypothetical protein [Tannerellaceae bacterium]
MNTNDGIVMNFQRWHRPPKGLFPSPAAAGMSRLMQLEKLTNAEEASRDRRPCRRPRQAVGQNWEHGSLPRHKDGEKSGIRSVNRHLNYEDYADKYTDELSKYHKRNYMSKLKRFGNLLKLSNTINIPAKIQSRRQSTI